MTSPLLIVTNFRTPCSRTDFIPRRLGFGKTMLAMDRIQARDQARRAWLSLYGSDDQAALQRRDAGIGETALAMLTAHQPPALEIILTTLINGLAAIDESLVTVIKDYQLDKHRMEKGLIMPVPSTR